MGSSSAGQFNQYNYRFYAETGNALAVDNAGMIYLLGPITGNKIRLIGPVTSFRKAVIKWENTACAESAACMPE